MLGVGYCSVILYVCTQVYFLEPFPYHLNVSQRTGQICLGLLGNDDKKWDPTFTIEHILYAITAILIRPELSTSMDHSTLNEYHHFTHIYNQNAQKSARESAKKFKTMS